MRPSTEGTLVLVKCTRCGRSKRVESQDAVDRWTEKHDEVCPL